MKKLFSYLMVAVIGLSLLSSCTATAKKVYITQKKAQTIAEGVVKNENQAQIINYSAPEIDKVQEEQSHKVSLTNKNKVSIDNNLKGKTVWKVTYKTRNDGLLGPITVYIDYYSGKIYGTDLRL